MAGTIGPYCGLAHESHQNPSGDVMKRTGATLVTTSFAILLGAFTVPVAMAFDSSPSVIGTDLQVKVQYYYEGRQDWYERELRRQDRNIRIQEGITEDNNRKIQYRRALLDRARQERARYGRVLPETQWQIDSGYYR